jgi:hypothetical protein
MVKGEWLNGLLQLGKCLSGMKWQEFAIDPLHQLTLRQSKSK